MEEDQYLWDSNHKEYQRSKCKENHSKESKKHYQPALLENTSIKAKALAHHHKAVARSQENIENYNHRQHYND